MTLIPGVLSALVLAQAATDPCWLQKEDMRSAGKGAQYVGVFLIVDGILGVAASLTYAASITSTANELGIATDTTPLWIAAGISALVALVGGAVYNGGANRQQLAREAVSECLTRPRPKNEAGQAVADGLHLIASGPKPIGIRYHGTFTGVEIEYVKRKSSGKRQMLRKILRSTKRVQAFSLSFHGGQGPLNLIDGIRLEARLAALRAHPRGYVIPGHVIALAIDAEGGRAVLELALAMHALHGTTLRLKSADQSSRSGSYAVTIAR